MHRLICAVLISLACLLPASAQDAAGPDTDQEGPWTIVAIPVSGEVNAKLARTVKEGLRKGAAYDRVAYVLIMDTFGGRLDAAWDIVDTLQHLGRSRTAAFVKSKAISAGALIALACQDVYMHPSATIGDCMPIVVSFDGPKEVGEKVQSPLRAKFRSLAESNGYPAKLAEAMVTKELTVFRVETDGAIMFLDDTQLAEATQAGDSIVSTRTVVKAGELLTMSAGEALDYGFSRQTVENVEQVVGAMGFEQYRLEMLPGGGGWMASWSAMSGPMKVYWLFAIPATVFFLLMVALTLIGLGGEGFEVDAETDVDVGDMDIDVDADGGGALGDASEAAGAAGAFHFFTVRNFISFFMMFGWTGIALTKSGVAPVGTFAGAMFGGLITMFAVSLLFYLATKLTESGNISIKEALNLVGNVYLTIPANRGGTGKVSVVVKGSRREYKAMTDGDELKTGETARIHGITAGEVLLVKREAKTS